MTAIKRWLSLGWGYYLFLVCRITGVAIRPLTLFVALQLQKSEFATEYALLLTTISSVFTLLGNQNHRELYAYFVGDAPERRGLGGKQIFSDYFDGVIAHGIFFLPLVCLLGWLWTENVYLLIAALPLIYIEKYYDDDQRYLIYNRDYKQWIYNFLFRNIIPSAVLIISIIFFEVDGILVYISMILICLAIYLAVFREKFMSIVMIWAHSAIRRGLRSIGRRVGAYFRRYREEFFAAQIFVISSAHMLLIDRFLVSKFFEDMFAEYVLVANILAAIPLIHNLLYFTRIRPKLIDRSHPVVRTFFSPSNLIVPLLGAAGFIVFSQLLGRIGVFGIPFELSTLAGLAVAYSLAAMLLVLQEFAFWRVKRYWLVLVDIFALASMAFSIFNFPLEIGLICWSLAFTLVIKIMLLLFLDCTKKDIFLLPLMRN